MKVLALCLRRGAAYSGLPSRCGRYGSRSARKSVAWTAALLTGIVAGTSAVSADNFAVSISPKEPRQFIEGTTVSGRIAWSVPSLTAVLAGDRVRLDVVIEATDADAVPVDPWVSELSLTGWPAEYPDQAEWSFEWLSSSIGGPRNTWWWSVEIAVDSQFAFGQAGEIASASWRTGGDDVDGFPDDGTFEIIASAEVLHPSGPDLLWLHHGQDGRCLNPEPVPGPQGLLLLAGGLPVLLARRRKGHYDEPVR